LKCSVVVASERFHDSLDELENEIFQAQTVLRRDMALMRADRKKREAAAKEKEVEKVRHTAGSTTQKSAPVMPKAEVPPTIIPVAAPVKVEPPVRNNTPLEPPPGPLAPTRQIDDAPPPAVPVAPVAPAAVANPPVGSADTSMATQDTEFDFDALFADSMDAPGADGNDQTDMNLDVSQANLNMDNGPDLDFTLDDSGPSLLRGLEDFAKSSDDDAGQNPANIDVDFPMPDLPDTNANVSTHQPAAKPTDDFAAPQATNSNDLDLNAMTTDNLDDLFDLEYSNPEATQFDDAFFGYGE
jgi:hypothetical protein